MVLSKNYLVHRTTAEAMEMKILQEPAIGTTSNVKWTLDNVNKSLNGYTTFKGVKRQKSKKLNKGPVWKNTGEPNLK